MKHLILVFLSISLFVACAKKDEVSAGKYGMLGDDTPQYTAVLFLRAIYNEKTLNKAIDISTQRFARIINAYHTNKTVQRQVFNLRLDTMTTEPISGGSLLFAERQNEAQIDMKIDGEYNGKKVIDLKTISMIKVDGSWKVNDVSNTAY